MRICSGAVGEKVAEKYNKGMRAFKKILFVVVAVIVVILTIVYGGLLNH